MNNSYDILETCLQDVENGMDPEEVLARYPDHADELRPILESSVNARRMAVAGPSAEILKRNRAKLLRHASQLREELPATSSRWFPSFQRLAVALVLLVLFFVSGTSLVRAASSALPGDSLYSVKRSWEDVTLFFTFDENAYNMLQIEYENERLEEINGLFASGRPAQVDFAGVVTRQNENGWRVANIVVNVSPQTDLPAQPVQIGMALRVIGITNGDGTVLAERIELLPADAPLPEVEDEQPQATPQPNNGGPDSGSGTEAPEIEVTVTPSPVATPRIESFEGILNSIDNEAWMINGILVNVADAEIKGVPVIGARVRAEGYYGPDGVFVAIKIEILDQGPSTEDVNSNNNDDEGANTNGNGNDNGDDNSNSNSNNNDNSNHNGNENGNDDNGNNDNGSSGSGGGGGD